MYTALLPRNSTPELVTNGHGYKCANRDRSFVAGSGLAGLSLLLETQYHPLTFHGESSKIATYSAPTLTHCFPDKFVEIWFPVVEYLTAHEVLPKNPFYHNLYF